MTVIKLEKFLGSEDRMDYLWTIKEVRRACGVPTKGVDADITGVSIDSRTVKKGDLFIALKNEKDGHDYIQKAYENGAVCAVVDHAIDGCPIEQVVVEDTFKALWKMADAQRSWGEGVQRIAVTGSCGKTSVKELLGSALTCHKSEGSYNNHWGVPLTLARMPEDTEYAVIEIGMNHPGEIAPLARMAAPHVALVTTVAAAHLEAFDDITGIAVEKASIFEGVVPNGVAVLNADIETSAILMAKAQDCKLRDITFEKSSTSSPKNCAMLPCANVRKFAEELRDIRFAQIALPSS